ncbi:MAG: group II intron reverse transcriptase domain-containing protein [Candidatus Magasanikbacteria bacterium]|nr:group II intron reverse transcriptase domain-containing protein [Candidatus Magasanikbacteria bacterium]
MPQQITLFEYSQNGEIGTIPLGGGRAYKIVRRLKQLSHTFDDISSLENLCLAWEEFIIGKKKKADVIEFGRNLMDNIVELHEALVNKTYCHGGYKSFYINDPKRRHIHKASVRDRLLHHAVYRILYPFFDKTFIADSFSCRDEKGMHRAINRFRKLAFQISKNHTRTCRILKCDIKKFFASIDHEILLNILKEYIPDKNIMWLLMNIVESFETARPLPSGQNLRAAPALSSAEERDDTFPPPQRRGREGRSRRVGLPLGNLTSQLFANVYMNSLDQWVKHRLGVETQNFASLQYVRYADDFVFLSHNKLLLQNIIPSIQKFLTNHLRLTLHPDKIFLKTLASGVDFLGWAHFPNHRVPRTRTKQRMFRKIKQSPREETLQSYLGLLRHGNTAQLQKEAVGEYWLWR